VEIFLPGKKVAQFTGPQARVERGKSE